MKCTHSTKRRSPILTNQIALTILLVVAITSHGQSPSGSNRSSIFSADYSHAVSGRQWDYDGSRILSVIGPDAVPTLWNADTGAIVRTFPGHTDEVRVVALSPDGRLAATGSGFTTDVFIQRIIDCTARVWDVSTGKEVYRFDPLRSHPLITSGNAVDRLQFSPDGHRLLVIADSAQVWDLASQRVLYSFPADSATLSPDMRTILARDEGHFSLRDYKDGHALCSLGVFWDAQYSPDGKQIAAAVQDGELFSAQVLDVHTCHLKLTIPVGQRILTALSYSGDGKTVVGSATGSTAIVWDAKTGMVTHEIGTTTARQVSAAILNHDGTRLLTKWQPATLDQEFVSLWDVETGKELHRFLAYDEQHPSDRNHSTGVIGFSPDGTVIPVATDGKLSGLWSAATGQLIRSFQ